MQLLYQQITKSCKELARFSEYFLELTAQKEVVAAIYDFNSVPKTSNADSPLKCAHKSFYENIYSWKQIIATHVVTCALC